MNPVDVHTCQSDEPLAGVKREAYFADHSWFHRISPVMDYSAAKSYEQLATVSDIHYFNGHHGFLRFEILSETGQITATKTGVKGQFKFNNEYEGTLPLTGAEQSGFLRWVKNRPLLVLVRDNNELLRQLGTETTAAYFSELALQSGKKAEDVNGIPFKVSALATCPAPIYNYFLTDVLPFRLSHLL